MRGLLLVATLVLPLMCMAENWTGFRGPTGQGISTETNLPTEWDKETNIAWKYDDPGSGWSSPIIYKEKVFLTTATDEGQSCRLICLSRDTGEELWNKEIFRQELKNIERRNSFATPTPVTDGKHVYVLYNDGSIAAVDLDGNIVWKNRDYPYYSQHGLGVSPILHEDLLIIPFDYSSETGDKKVGWQIPWDKSFIVALNKNTGKKVWIGKRGMSRIAHVTPNIYTFEDGRSILISAAGDVIQGFNLSNGSLIWTVDTGGEGVVPSIVIGDGLIYGPSGFTDHYLVAVRPDGKGNVTETHVAWKDKNSTPNVPSALYKKPYLYTITDSGISACRDAQTGEMIWRERIGGNYYASPVWADGKIYFLSMDGETVIIEDGTEYNEITKNDLGEKCQASIAVSGGKLFIRSENALYCISK